MILKTEEVLMELEMAINTEKKKAYNDGVTDGIFQATNALSILLNISDEKFITLKNLVLEKINETK